MLATSTGLVAGITGSYSPSVTISSDAPTVTFVEDPGAQTPTAGGTSSYSFTATVDDPNGWDTLSVVNVSVSTAAGDQDGSPRTNASCVQGNSYDTTKINYTCSISHKYYDEAGTWTIEVYTEDSSGLSHSNSSVSYTVNSIDGLELPSTPSWNTMSPSNNNVEATTHLQLNNTGNTDYGTINITAYDLTDNGNTFSASNFEVDQDSGFGTPTSLQDSTSQTTDGLLNAGSEPSTETIYHRVDVPDGTSSGTYSPTSSWQIEAVS